MLLREYGMTINEYHDLEKAQSGTCAICSCVPKNGDLLVVDHSHKSERVRGLLCGRCNSAIGLLGDDPDVAESAATYLRRKEA